MLTGKAIVVGLGELLWDLFPAGKQLGGAPANFAYIASLLGDEGIAASRLGQDDLGAEAIHRLGDLGLPTEFIQRDADRPTGTVKVEVDPAGQPRFEISESVAWDFLEWTPDWQRLAENADAVCFGSLAQRSEESRATVRNFLRATPPGTVKVFDVNLRQSYYSTEVLAESMKLADIVKLNEDELPKIMSLAKFPHKDDVSSAQRLISTYDLKLLCLTRGGRGSLLVRNGDASEHPGFRVPVADTVGSGDAFTAGLVHEYLHGASLDLMNEVANLVGAWVTSEVGAMPAPKRGALENSLAEIR